MSVLDIFIKSPNFIAFVTDFRLFFLYTQNSLLHNKAAAAFLLVAASSSFTKNYFILHLSLTHSLTRAYEMMLLMNLLICLLKKHQNAKSFSASSLLHLSMNSLVLFYFNVVINTIALQE